MRIPEINSTSSLLIQMVPTSPKARKSKGSINVFLYSIKFNFWIPWTSDLDVRLWVEHIWQRYLQRQILYQRQTMGYLGWWSHAYLQYRGHRHFTFQITWSKKQISLDICQFLVFFSIMYVLNQEETGISHD